MKEIRVLGGPGTQAISFPSRGRITWLGSTLTPIELLLSVRATLAEVVLLIDGVAEAPVSQLLDEYPDVKVMVIGKGGDVSVYYQSTIRETLGQWFPETASILIEQAYEVNNQDATSALH